MNSFVRFAAWKLRSSCAIQIMFVADARAKQVRLTEDCCLFIMKISAAAFSPFIEARANRITRILVLSKAFDVELMKRILAESLLRKCDFYFPISTRNAFRPAPRKFTARRFDNLLQSNSAKAVSLRSILCHERR